ncbi:hypothetical protein SGRI78S_07326 [Streptomyces griseus subsp. griseus]
MAAQGVDLVAFLGAGAGEEPVDPAEGQPVPGPGEQPGEDLVRPLRSIGVQLDIGQLRQPAAPPDPFGTVERGVQLQVPEHAVTGEGGEAGAEGAERAQQGRALPAGPFTGLGKVAHLGEQQHLRGARVHEPRPLQR